MAQRKVAEHEAGHAALLNDVLGRAHHHGGNAGDFEVARHHGHCLVAYRAVGHQHRNFQTVVSTALQHFWTVDLHRVALAAVGEHTVEARRQRTDAARGRGLHWPQPRLRLLGGKQDSACQPAALPQRSTESVTPTVRGWP
jgi:hypothetical protein